ncbi:MAG: hypothetical protein V1721_02570 [Pseudomonadota bacterium]
MTEVYSKIIEPRLPVELAAGLKPWVLWLDIATPIIIALIIILSIYYAYYQLEKEVTRSHKVTKKLKELYAQSGELLMRKITIDGLHSLKVERSNWYKQTRGFISEKMEPSTLTRFCHFQMSLPYNHGSTVNDDHQITLNGLNIYHKNLQEIIDSQEWK